MKRGGWVKEERGRGCEREMDRREGDREVERVVHGGGKRWERERRIGSMDDG